MNGPGFVSEEEDDENQREAHPVGGETLQGAEPAAIMELDDPDVRFLREIAYDFLAQIQGNALLVTGTLATAATFAVQSLPDGLRSAAAREPIRVSSRVARRGFRGLDGEHSGRYSSRTSATGVV